MQQKLKKDELLKLGGAENNGNRLEKSEKDDAVETRLNEELNNLETLIENAGSVNVALVGTTVEMLRSGFINRHGSFKEFSQKGGDLGDYVNVLLDMAIKYRTENSPPGEWASRLCALHASAVHIENHLLAERAETLMDTVTEVSRLFEKS